MITSRYQPPMLTTGERVRNLLWCALALSLVLHALATPIFPNQARIREDDSPVPITFDRPRPPVRIVTPAPPKPQARHLTQQNVASHSLPVRVPRTVAPNVGPPDRVPSNVSPHADTGVVTTVPNTEVSNPTQTPSCPDPNRDAVASNVVSPEYPDSVGGTGLGKVAVLVAVTIDASGSVSDARISQSSGNGLVDQAALRAARDSSYKPQLVNCVPSPGTYIFRAEFAPDN